MKGERKTKVEKAVDVLESLGVSDLREVGSLVDRDVLRILAAGLTRAHGADTERDTDG